MHRHLLAIGLMSVLALSTRVVVAQSDSSPEATPATQHESPPETVNPSRTKLIIGYKIAPPFAIKNADGSWTGLSIELWRHIAHELDFDYEIRETDIPGLVQGLKAGTLDAAVAALTVTAEREKLFDFTHPFYTTGLGIAVKKQRYSNWRDMILGFFSWRFLRPLGGLFLILLLVGTLVWSLERKSDAGGFAKDPARGIAGGFWWSAVTMTTVGYGDKSPVTFAGRGVAIIWMFVSIITISGFTAAIASSLTISKLGKHIDGPEDLLQVRVGSIPKTTTANYLDRQHIIFRPYDTPLSGLQALEENHIDAFVYDAPILRYLIKREIGQSVHVLPGTFERQDYAIGLVTNSDLREAINRLMLQHIHEHWWHDTLFGYLGR